MMRKKHQSRYRVVSIIYLVIVTFTAGCYTKVYPDEKMRIDPVYLLIFNSITKKDTLVFKNLNGKKKIFKISHIDSVIRNKKGWFINEKPYSIFRAHINEVGTDTTSLERENEIFVAKDPSDNTNTLCIKFNNFYYNKDNKLPTVNKDSILYKSSVVTNYYALISSLEPRNSDDIEFLYISVPFGILSFITKSGEIWEIM